MCLTTRIKLRDSLARGVLICNSWGGDAFILLLIHLVVVCGLRTMTLDSRGRLSMGPSTVEEVRVPTTRTLASRCAVRGNYPSAKTEILVILPSTVTPISYALCVHVLLCVDTPTDRRFQRLNCCPT